MMSSMMIFFIKIRHLYSDISDPEHRKYNHHFSNRRPDRYHKMDVSLKELGISYKHFPAVDGKNLTQKELDRLGIKAMADFKDPYLERPLTFGEIGCFLSHWYDNH